MNKIRSPASYTRKLSCLFCGGKFCKATFIRRISAVLNAIQTIDNEANHLIIYCLNCIRHGRNATYEPGLRKLFTPVLSSFVSFTNNALS